MVELLSEIFMGMEKNFLYIFFLSGVFFLFLFIFDFFRVTLSFSTNSSKIPGISPLYVILYYAGILFLGKKIWDSGDPLSSESKIYSLGTHHRFLAGGDHLGFMVSYFMVGLLSWWTLGVLVWAFPLLTGYLILRVIFLVSIIPLRKKRERARRIEKSFIKMMRGRNL